MLDGHSDSASVERWVSLSPLPGAVLAGLIALVVISVAAAAFGLRREPRVARRWGLRGLRALAGLCAVAFLFELGTRRVQVARMKMHIAVLLDRSLSMRFPVEPKGQTRMQWAQAAASKLVAPDGDETKTAEVAFDWYSFGSELTPLGALTDQQASEPKTDLGQALRALASTAKDTARPLAGAVIFSDGADTQGLFAAGNEANLQSALDALGVPVSAVAVGISALKDLSVDNVKMDEFAFVRNALNAEVEVTGRGFAGQTVPVVFQREGQVVATKLVRFETDNEVKKVEFTFSPDQTGRFVYTFSTPVLPDEALKENNSKSVTLKVIRDRVRVLLVAGRPTWDERFVRGVLRGDPNVELVSFYILRTATDDSSAQESELSLIPFPREEIFERKISTFDVVVVMNFGHTEQGTSIGSYAGSISNYVKKGGALAYLGGDASFGESRGTAFDALLPLETAGPANLEPFSVRLTVEGTRHPITAFRSVTASGDSLWSTLAQVPGLNSTRAREGSTVLLEHPFYTIAGKNAPLVAVWEQERGRVMAIASDGTWYWALPSKSKGDASRLYERFWSQAIRWLVRDPDLTTLSVTADATTFAPGRPVAVTAESKTSDYQPAARAAIEVELRSAETGAVVERKTAETGDDGTVKFEFAPPLPGAYKIVSKASKEGKPLGEFADAFAVRESGAELNDASVNGAQLENIAKRSRGRFWDNAVPSKADIPVASPPEVEVGRAKEQPLWPRWPWMFGLVAVLTIEWGLRRRFGYA